MSEQRIRPSDLPEFDSPPINELVLGVQIARPRAYDDRLVNETWNLFSDEYPRFQEVARLEPVFEVFGNRTGLGLNLDIQLGPVGKRYWFLAEDDSHLIQFQDDRLFVNWRQARLGEQTYPRFHVVFPRFINALTKVRGFYAAKGEAFVVNQAEITYVNVIPLGESAISDWLRVVQTPFPISVDGLQASFSETVHGNDNRPHARLHHRFDLVALTKDGSAALKVELTYRGAPKDVDDALNLVWAGRDRIVRRFTEMTTDHAHETWRRRR